MKKLAVILSKVSFIGIDLLDGVFGMTTAGNTERKIGTVMVGSRGYFRSEDKPVAGINGSMFLKSEMRYVILDCPVGIEIPGEFKDIPIFIEITLGCFSFLYFFFQFFFTYGTAGGLNQTGVNSYAFVDG